MITPSLLRPSARTRRGLAALAAVLVAACGNLQRSPGPMPFGEAGEGPVLREPVARVVRHGDPVQYRPAGEAGSVMMAFHRKQAELPAGSWVFTGAPGRAEFLKPSGASAILFGTGAAHLGDGRSTPWLSFEEFDRVRLLLEPGDRVGLPGGAQLEPLGDPDGPAGPFVLEKLEADQFRVHNQGVVPLRVRYREEVLELRPAERVSLGRIARPYALDPEAGGTAPLLARTRELDLAGRPVRVVGDVAVQEEEGGSWRLTARGGPASVIVQGLVVDLADGEHVVWRFPEGPPAD